MRIFKDLTGADVIKNPVVTTGSFDGVHLGHMTILNRLNQIAKQVEGESVLITFHPHPRKVLYPDTAGKDLLLINSQQEKIELLEKAGLDNLIIIQFTLEFAKTTSIDFIRRILVGQLHAKCIVVGFNHHFGHNREGSFEYLYELGKYYDFMVEEIPEQDIENETVSSTRIRKSLLEGKIQRVNAYLNHLYMIFGPTRAGEETLRKHGIPNLEIVIEEEVKLIPPPGVYATQVEMGSQKHKGMVIIMITGRAEEGQHQSRVFLHFPDTRPVDIQGQVKVYFHKQVREGLPEPKDEAALKLLQRDLAHIQDLIY